MNKNRLKPFFSNNIFSTQEILKVML